MTRWLPAFSILVVGRIYRYQLNLNYQQKKQNLFVTLF